MAGVSKYTEDIAAQICDLIAKGQSSREVAKELGISDLEERANDPKTAAAFLGLVGKVLPMTIANEPGSEFRISVIERKIVHPKH